MSNLVRNRSVAVSANIFEMVAQTPAVQSLLRRWEKGAVWSCNAVTAGAQPFFTVLLRTILPHRPLVVVTDGLKSQERFQQDVETWWAVQTAANGHASHCAPTGVGVPAPERAAVEAFPKPHFYPAWEVLPHEGRLPHADVISERLETLGALLAANPATGAAELPRSDPAGDGDRDQDSGAAPGRAGDGRPHLAPFIVTSVSALMQRTFTPAVLRQRTRPVQRGDRIDPLELIEWLEAQGYEPEAQVTRKGELAVRGGILDVFPLSHPWPVRLEFFGDELESLREFDPLSQLSRAELAGVTFMPGGEFAMLKRAAETHPDPSHRGRELATLLDYLSPETLLVLAEPSLLAQQADTYSRQIPAADPFFIPWEEFLRESAGRGMIRIELAEGPDSLPAESSPDFASLEAYRPVAEQPLDARVAEAQRREFFAQMHRWLRQDYAVWVFCNNDGERQRFGEIWAEYGLGQPTATNPPVIMLGALARGFIFDEGRLVVVTDAEIFGRYKVPRARRLKSPHALASRSALDIDFSNLEEGDLVVHLQHGIGRYLGLSVLAPGAGRRKGSGPGSQAGQECLVIEYAPNDAEQSPPKLYVPVTEAHLVGKYVGAGKVRPPLNTLGGNRWTKAKVHAMRAVRDLAGELLTIQAARESQIGHAFAPDTAWQREFEGSFLFEETPDQARAIADTKADMEQTRPMDRLICGDVGFGKTEVALRAAFKAVMGGKQVAILVPTTVLAQQHFNTFRERLADYPIRVELLSRFRTRREQQTVLQDLAQGAVDIVIGTHRLVQSDVTVKNLGLVVIDEEQRFGVLQKENFKRLRQLVDVLTLSATPIPRTLYLALTGARAMSTIETPPHDRLPVETMVIPYDERVLRDAIQRELNRQGQVFYLYNRVDTIEMVALRLRALVPQARLVVGHGQMPSDELEEVMTQFVNGEADVLLSTTIIESGLDIPNANTIIIDRADRFGLSDLYQLRGRVGRYKHQAYAYFLLPRHATLLADARKRLSAIKQYSRLGSGFKIALRDLEIRGAGNLLGPEQSGHITAIGFDLYCQLLKQSVSALKGEKVRPRLEVQARLDFLAMDPSEKAGASEPGRGEQPKASREDSGIRVPREVATWVSDVRAETPPAGLAESNPPLAKAAAYIPFDYIAEPRLRIEMYRKLAQANDAESLQQLSTEMMDRFGPLPSAVEILLQVAALKLLAGEKGVTVIETRGDKLMLIRHQDYLMSGGKFPRLTRKTPKGRLSEIRRFLQSL